MPVFVASSAIVSDFANLKDGCTVWHWSQIREDVELGEQCSIGQACYLGPGVRIGKFVRIQNGAMIYEPAVVGDGAFIGPHVIFTNDSHPRAIRDEASTPIGGEDWTRRQVIVGMGASVGAASVLVGPVKVGNWALVGAGSVVTRDVPAFGLVIGNPARQVGWVGFAGKRLRQISPDYYTCDESGQTYSLKNGEMVPLRDSLSDERTERGV